MKKSSANPVEVKTLSDLTITQVGMGVSHSIFLVKPKTEKEEKKLEGMPTLDQSDQDK